MHGRVGFIGGGIGRRDVAATTADLERATGTGRVRIGSDGGLVEFYQEGALRLRLPRMAAGDPAEVVVVNAAGGLTGGDRLDLTVTLDGGARAVLTTPACEKVYRSAAGEAVVTNTVHLDADSRLDWLPQPMLLFDGARVSRRLDVDMTPDASLLAVEGVILGRTAMAETLRSGVVHDAWRIRRGGRLIFADAFAAKGDVSGALAGKATLAGALAFATTACVAPDAEARLEATRDILGACRGEVAASAWNGMLIARFVAADGQGLIDDLGLFLRAFRGASLPRSWLC